MNDECCRKYHVFFIQLTNDGREVDDDCDSLCQLRVDVEYGGVGGDVEGNGVHELRHELSVPERIENTLNK